MNKIIGCLLIICAVSSLKDTKAQDGGWVSYSLEGFGSGTAYYDCGDGCIGYTRANARHVLIFDITVGDWMLADLGEIQTFKYLQTEGDVVMAWSEDLLFGYSSGTGAWDTVYYEGTVLHDVSDQLLRSFGCSDSLAFFVTNRKFYVFDGSLGSWQQYDYGLPADFNFGYFYPEDDFILLVLMKTDTYDAPMNVVYSSHTHTFNKLDNGCLRSPGYDFNHGFAGYYGKCLLVGYSALDNQFDVIPYSTGDEETIVDYWQTDISGADKFIAYCVGFRTVVTPYKLVRVTFYGYSTLLGEWNTVTYDIDCEIESYSGLMGYTGGQFTVESSVFKESNSWNFFFYSASDGLFCNIPTDIIYNSATSALRRGGSVFCAFDDQLGWGYNPLTRCAACVCLDYDWFKYFYAGEDYATLCRWSSASDIMKIYFYNSITNKWTWKNIKKNTNASVEATAHVYLFMGEPENKVIVYSSFQDSVMQWDFAENINLYEYPKINGKLAMVRSAQQSVLFNAEKCTVYEKYFAFNQNGLGNGSAAFYDAANKTLYGYSSLSDQWTTLAVSEELSYCYDPGYIGLISAWVGTTNYRKYYAYNSLTESWVELTPEGAYISHKVGNRTALVVRSTHLYAFNPYGGTTGVKAVSDSPLNSGFLLKQNYPNPFNGSTTIDYELIRPFRVILKIYNALGQEVRTLVNENQTVGEWSIIWDGMNGSKQPVGPGIYIYQLQVGDAIQNRKMMLMKSGIH